MSSLKSPPPIPPASNLRSAATACGGATLSLPSTTRVSCSLKQKRGSNTSSRDAPPLFASEDLAVAIAVAGLERLFRDPPAADPAGPGRRVRIAYQGGRGSYCHDAAARALSTAADAFPCSNMEGAFAALEDGSADRAVVPAENSLDGPVDRNLDLLLRHPTVAIVGELVLPVNHCLLALPGGDLRRVVSHPQALAHCAPRLRTLGLAVEEVACAANAARFVAENRIAGTAVIGSRIAAREFDLDVVEENLQGAGGNFTRFLQLGLGSGGVGGGGGGGRKTTVAFALERGPTDLFNAMWGFESRGVRITRVDHRPNRARPVRVRAGPAYLDYVFVLDLEGGEGDADVADGLVRLREFARYVRVLGSYTCTCGVRE